MNNVKLITRKKNIGDKSVTSTYLDIIMKSLSKVDFSINRRNILVFDECKIAFKYVFFSDNDIYIWIQGIVPEEALLQGYSKIRYYMHSLIEYIVLKKAKFVFFCSEEMKSHYERKYGLVFHNYFIMPCFNELSVDTFAFLNKDKYSSNVFAYIGSLHAWQCFDKTLELYKKIEIESNNNTKLLVCTSDCDSALNKISKSKIVNFEVKFVNPSELGHLLNQVKYGFVLRDNCEVNRVATPTKISNYLSHGVIPIYSDCLKSFDSINKNSKGFGIVCNTNEIDEGVKRIIKSLSEDFNFKSVEEWCNFIFDTYYNRDKYIIDISTKINKLYNSQL